MAVLLLAATGGPQVAPTIGLYQLMGYNVLVISFIPGLRVLAPVFRRGSG
jgi:ubiquinone biosynthesis protein